MSGLKIVACGGGSFTGNASVHFEAALNLSGSEKPNILAIPTARPSQKHHTISCQRMKDFGKSRGLNVRVLHGYDTRFPSPSELAEHLAWADLCAFNGGNTDKMMRTWGRRGYTEVFYRGIIDGDFAAFGVSAGMLAWFSEGWSDSDSYVVPEGAPWEYRAVDCLGVIENVLATPHLNTNHPLTGMPRLSSLRMEMMNRQPGAIGFGLDNLAALQIIGKQAQILSADGSSVAQRITRAECYAKAEALSPGDGVMQLHELFGTPAH